MKLIEYAFNDYNTIRPHSSIDYLAPDEFEKRCMESDNFKEKFMERREERILKNRMEKKRRLKENVSFEIGKKCPILKDSDHSHSSSSLLSHSSFIFSCCIMKRNSSYWFFLFL